MVLQILSSSTTPNVTWEALRADFVLPDDPVENIQQPPLAAALTDALGAAGRIEQIAPIGSHFGLVATVNKQTVVKAPDWFFVPQVHGVAEGTIRRSYTPNLEGAPVSVVMEFLSNEDYSELSVRSTPPYGKLYFYEQILRVPTYVTYDPYEPKLEVRYLLNGAYETQAADASGRVRIPEFDLWLGIWSGERLGQTMNWLRWWDEAGNLLLWSSEQAEYERLRAQQERQRADLWAAKLRELGVDIDRVT
ncbi:Uma2 family endonuclease [Tychonema sp. LEGE 07199]|uniref:Uma2 family endonuclease n=1 Tax=unclassified Tychonema TaxID=2642144 RepID=UPI001881E235|nr:MULTISPECIES: Uma2 family endonuclease [unclassified Tychonema]MBE9121388.1 Uma2 family endonuclease [Tychonema sp. LEGE 07199]MBE9132546.1 Uma2 family endonuclease [Tychonema sp. LEGE 07196]